MSRPFPLPRLVFLSCTVALLLGCKTVYTDMYTHRRNYFHPPVETTKIELPPERKSTPPPVQALPVPGAGAPAIPGLAPVPDMGGLPAPAPAPAPPPP